MPLKLDKDLLERSDILFKHGCDVAAVGHADLLPHDRGSRGDSGNILEAACGQLLHHAALLIVLPDQVYQAGSNEVGQMADGGHDPVVFPEIQDNGNGSDQRGKLCHKGGGGGRGLLSRSKDVIGIFQQMIAKTWLRTAKIKDVGAYFAVSDAKSELSPWDSRLQVSSRGYMLGYSDLKDLSVSGFFRFLAKVGDNGMKMQIVKIGFGGRQ